MELRQLAVVVAVAEEGGFTAAAQRLRTVQSTVSTVVRALERDLGTPLFHRTTHRVVLTPAGEAFVPAARAALEAAERARAAVSPVAGRVRLGVCPGLLADLHRTLAALRHTHPGLGVEVRQVRPEEAGRGLRESTVDVALMPACGDFAVGSIAASATPAGAAAAAANSAPAGPHPAPAAAPAGARPGLTTAPADAAAPPTATPAGSRSGASDPAAPPATAPTSAHPSTAPASAHPSPTTAPAEAASAAVVSPLAAEELVLATAPGGSPSAPADLSALSLVDFPMGWAIRDAVDRAFPHRLVALEVDDLAVAGGLVRAGIAACVLPASVAGRFADLTVRRFSPAVPWQLVAVRRADCGPAVAAVLAQLG
ncbi:LysR family transcriptional regulator [Amycolatopsis sp.]|uniref:LysR family transcriptional regulator n=1 Tax=Amycolatopsis sp. TaxID=37632 RepID=UPI002D810E6C|nr:LysR family transcriptional regulator [Amycolatopsis sp.]HET6709795.1 LysR family transcriptional regulator [Amycolatopsis sp.]